MVVSKRGAFLHPRADVENQDGVGRSTRVWAFTHILPGARIGADCNICDHVFIENDVFVGDRVTVKCGVQLWDGTVLEDDVFVGPNATFTNDVWPRSRHRRAGHKETRVCRGASIGANATILPGITIGEHAMVGAGAVVTRDVPAATLVVGNPARIVQRQPKEILLTVATDERGSIAVAEFAGLPFQPKRVFMVHDVSDGGTRGGHAHRECEQILVAASGSIGITLIDAGGGMSETLLDSPGVGLHIPSMIWAAQHDWAPGAVLLVLASHPYDRDDYITSLVDFRKTSRGGSFGY